MARRGRLSGTPFPPHYPPGSTQTSISPRSARPATNGAWNSRRLRTPTSCGLKVAAWHAGGVRSGGGGGGSRCVCAYRADRAPSGGGCREWSQARAKERDERRGESSPRPRGESSPRSRGRQRARRAGGRGARWRGRCVQPSGGSRHRRARSGAVLPALGRARCCASGQHRHCTYSLNQSPCRSHCRLLAVQVDAERAAVRAELDAAQRGQPSGDSAARGAASDTDAEAGAGEDAEAPLLEDVMDEDLTEEEEQARRCRAWLQERIKCAEVARRICEQHEAADDAAGTPELALYFAELNATEMREQATARIPSWALRAPSPRRPHASFAEQLSRGVAWAGSLMAHCRCRWRHGRRSKSGSTRSARRRRRSDGRRKKQRPRSRLSAPPSSRRRRTSSAAHSRSSSGPEGA